MYENTPTPCLENWPKFLKKENKSVEGGGRLIKKNVLHMDLDLVQNPHPPFLKASYGPVNVNRYSHFFIDSITYRPLAVMCVPKNIYWQIFRTLQFKNFADFGFIK